jgi:hypothetical protein
MQTQIHDHSATHSQYPGTILTNRNEIHDETRGRINSANVSCYEVGKLLTRPHSTTLKIRKPHDTTTATCFVCVRSKRSLRFREERHSEVPRTICVPKKDIIGNLGCYIRRNVVIYTGQLLLLRW